MSESLGFLLFLATVAAGIWLVRAVRTAAATPAPPVSRGVGHPRSHDRAREADEAFADGVIFWRYFGTEPDETTDDETEAVGDPVCLDHADTDDDDEDDEDEGWW